MKKIKNVCAFAFTLTLFSLVAYDVANAVCPTIDPKEYYIMRQPNGEKYVEHKYPGYRLIKKNPGAHFNDIDPGDILDADKDAYLIEKLKEQRLGNEVHCRYHLSSRVGDEKDPDPFYQQRLAFSLVKDVE